MLAQREAFANFLNKNVSPGGSNLDLVSTPEAPGAGEL